MAGSSGNTLREFQASWRSSTGSVTWLVLLIAVILGLFGLLGPGGAGAWWFLAAAGLLFWMAWLLGRQLISKQAALRIGPRGIRAHALKGRKLSWNDIADVRAESVQGHTQIVLSLAPHIAASAPGAWWRGKEGELRIPLAVLRKKEHADVVAAVTEAFALYGGSQALKAAEVRLEELLANAAFEARLKKMTPMTWALYLVIALNIGEWLANVLAGMEVFRPSSSDLFRWGANSAASVVEDRQYWRLLTATFLHAGLLHIALNMLGLWEAGKQLNRLYGNTQFLLIYFASALTGSALSLHFSAQQSVSVGASGAVFGVLGALLMAMHRYRGRLPGLMSKNIVTSQVIFLVYALGQGFAKDGIDNAAHVGGLVAGCLLAQLLDGKVDDHRTSGWRSLAMGAALFIPALTVAGLVMTTPVPTVHHRQLFEFQAGMSRLLPDLNAAGKALQDDSKAASAGALSPEQLTKAIETRHLPAYQKVERELASLGVPPNDRAAPQVQDIKRGHSLLVEMMTIEVDRARAAGGNNLRVDARIKAIQQELQDIATRTKQRNLANNPKK